ncbi:unnamed protein product [Didymodactylos carnosus]|uniref:Uncharacterized protein n=1 Tax=Didymodactylos carnosus TaxID=1234261 RepID=A0A815N880_9BILA|nr:unnamed protein product [Didymodactylos carnosus]CAF1429732.1 unnamed protein product [Didymodactylos carnosus]CAF3758141.1 unnamed protein product [Didymodactylos carnosus]CAF4308831.1 unnamed protein product [Didymodactylos carnosus]
MCFIQGRPRHHQSQGCIECAIGVLCIALGKWLDTNNSVHWSDGLLPVVYGINTRISSTTKMTPYEIMFAPLERAAVVVDEIVEQPTINETVTDDFDKQKENDNLTIDNVIPESFPLLNTNNNPNAASRLVHAGRRDSFDTVI